MSQAILTRIVL